MSGGRSAINTLKEQLGPNCTLVIQTGKTRQHRSGAMLGGGGTQFLRRNDTNAAWSLKK